MWLIPFFLVLTGNVTVRPGPGPPVGGTVMIPAGARKTFRNRFYMIGTNGDDHSVGSGAGLMPEDPGTYK